MQQVECSLAVLFSTTLFALPEVLQQPHQHNHQVPILPLQDLLSGILLRQAFFVCFAFAGSAVGDSSLTGILCLFYFCRICCWENLRGRAAKKLKKLSLPPHVCSEPAASTAAGCGPYCSNLPTCHFNLFLYLQMINYNAPNRLLQLPNSLLQNLLPVVPLDAVHSFPFKCANAYFTTDKFQHATMSNLILYFKCTKPPPFASALTCAGPAFGSAPGYGTPDAASQRHAHKGPAVSAARCESGRPCCSTR